MAVTEDAQSPAAIVKAFLEAMERLNYDTALKWVGDDCA